MNGSVHILAEVEISPKLIFGLIFFVIWVLSALVSWLNKKQQEARRQRMREELERRSRYAQTPPPPPRQRAPQRISEGIAQRFPDVLLPPSPPPAPPPPPPHRRPAPAPPKPSLRVPTSQQRRPAPVLPSLPSMSVAPAQPYVNITEAAARPKPSTVDAVAVKKWLNPATLRHQFILTEILQPPLALRPDRTDHA